jgi:hypothetical protein
VNTQKANPKKQRVNRESLTRVVEEALTRELASETASISSRINFQLSLPCSLITHSGTNGAQIIFIIHKTKRTSRATHFWIHTIMRAFELGNSLQRITSNTHLDYARLLPPGDREVSLSGSSDKVDFEIVRSKVRRSLPVDECLSLLFKVSSVL